MYKKDPNGNKCKTFLGNPEDGYDLYFYKPLHIFITITVKC